MDQATPIPRNTLTALLPVTLPILASACLSWRAATLLANVSEKSALKYAGNTLALNVNTHAWYKVGEYKLVKEKHLGINYC